jgi:flavin-binding protein dodecin
MKSESKPNEPASSQGVSNRGALIKQPHSIPSTGISKVIELYAESPKGWEDAVQLCLAEAVRTVRNITSINVDELSARVKDDSLQLFQVRCRIAFGVDDGMRKQH